MKRRDFLQSIGFATVAAGMLPSLRAAGASGQPMKAAVIGDSPRGRYGHSLELIFSNRPNIQIIAVADPSDGGRKKVVEAIGAKRGYKDYREMLEKERPDLVSVAPRWLDQRHAMVSAALAAGAHVYCEKPFTSTLAEADDLVAMARRLKRKLAVSHPIRFAPGIVYLKQQIAAGRLGEIRSIRSSGKNDRRAGGEDLFVHGTHVFDLVRYISGTDAAEVKARIFEKGKPITRASARKGVYDDVGPVAGDDVEAWFTLQNGVPLHHTTKVDPAARADDFRVEYIGSKASVRIECGYDPVITMTAGGKKGPLPGNPGDKLSKLERERLAANARVVDDWLAAIAEDREPQSSGYEGMKAIEMIHGVYAAAVSGGTVKFPLENRRHGLMS